MKKHELDQKIVDMSKTILSYCLSRTSNRHEAEDLAQDILLEAIKSSANLRDEKAFYGFMWSIANNVYRQWYKRKQQRRQCALTENVPDMNVAWDDGAEDDSDVNLLRRELSLLSEKYRRATILYYVDNKSCAEISIAMSISESMVKYLLFKSRKILKEGMNMTRNYGKQSYNPKELSLRFWGGKCNYPSLEGKLMQQNILLACYNDALTEEEISISIGVALPYLEAEIKPLIEHDLLMKKGNKYCTNVVIFTKEFTKEVDMTTKNLRRELSEIVKKTLIDAREDIINIGFAGAREMSFNTYKWQFCCIVLYQAIVEKLQKSIQIDYPVDKFGARCFVWCKESSDEDSWYSQFDFGISSVCNDDKGKVQFMDFPVNGKMVHHYFFNNQTASNVYLDIANGHAGAFSENDSACVADMIRQGYVTNRDGLKVNAPVFTKDQFAAVVAILNSATDEIAKKAEEILGTVSKILVNYTPAYLRVVSKNLAYCRLFDDTILAPVGMLYDDGFLYKPDKSDLLPTTYVVSFK